MAGRWPTSYFTALSWLVGCHPRSSPQLAAPLIIDLVLLTELFERVTVRRASEPPEAAARFHSVLSLLSYLLKAPLVPQGAPVVNALFKQREALVNVLRACIGLSPENHMLLEHRLNTAGTAAALEATGLLPAGKTAATGGKATCGASLPAGSATADA